MIEELRAFAPKTVCDAKDVTLMPIVDASLTPPCPASLSELLLRAARACEDGRAVAMATVVARHGSAPSTPGQKLLVVSAGSTSVPGIYGTVGGGAVEREVVRALLAMLEQSPTACGQARTQTFKLGAELGMCCGGRVDVFLEAMQGKFPCFLVGAGHVGVALAQLLISLDFQVVLTDSRDAFGDATGESGASLVHGAARGRAGACKIHVGDFDEVGRHVPRHGACLVMSHDHAHDQNVIEWALREGFAFVGGVGSRAKAERTRQRLTHRGFHAADIERVRMPLGIECKARSPQEIAVAIAAELIAWRATTSAVSVPSQISENHPIEAKPSGRV